MTMVLDVLAKFGSAPIVNGATTLACVAITEHIYQWVKLSNCSEVPHYFPKNDIQIPNILTPFLRQNLTPLTYLKRQNNATL